MQDFPAAHSHCLFYQWRGYTPIGDTFISHPIPPIAAPVLMHVGYEVMLQSLAKAHLFNRACYIAVCSF